MEIMEYKVGIAELAVTPAPHRLITVGLGSCIGIAMYDKQKMLGGLLHIMLPDSKAFNNINNAIKFADLALPILVEDMVKQGGNRRSFTAKIAGGASMFNFPDSKMIMDIGQRNIQAVKEKLKELSIPVLGEDVGGNKGRTMIFDTQNGIVQIRTIGMGVKEL